MTYRISIFLLAIFFALQACAQDAKKNKSVHFRIAFYNVENLFDTLDDPLKNDAEFLSTGRIPWTSERYERKLDRLSEVIAAMSDPGPVAVMGLCEVENQEVVMELVQSPRITKNNYRVIHRESPDERGIDNAMIYDPAQFTPVSVHALPVDLSSANGDLTRDILYVKGVPARNKKDTLHIFVNHWPSRSEGREISEPKRMIAAQTLKKATDSLIRLNTMPLIVIIGDFNDEPADKSLREILNAEPANDDIASGKLYNLMFPAYERGEGTLFWKDWDVFDQVIINGAIRENLKGFHYTGREAMIFNREFLLFTGSDGTKRPNRTAAKEYYGGYSDHLPVYFDLEKK
jgi:predicted extracellular nuclease